MTMTTDELFESIFHQAGDSFAVPESGSEEILRRAHGGDDADDSAQSTPEEAALVRTLWGTVRSHRLLAVAASVVLVVVVAGGSVLLTRRTPAPVSRSAASRSLPAPPTHASGTTATTTPGFSAAGTPAVAPTLGAASPQASSGTVAGGAAPAQNSTTQTAPPLPSGAVGSSAKIEQTGSLDLLVNRGTLSTVMSKLAFLATSENGFVANSQTQTGASAGTPMGSVTLQVPVDSFTVVLKEAQALGRTEQLSTKATDVTGQYVDLQARITALEASRQQYLTIMAKATTIGDVLAVQAQLDSLQSQIEQLQGQLQVLTGETAYSTLTVQVSERGTSHHVTPPHPESGIAKAWHDSVHGFVDGVEGLIRIAGPVLFVLLCLAALVIGGRVGWRRLQRRNL
jgi:hypothetical protein